MTSMPPIEKYLELIYKLSWSFHKTTGVPFEDLVSTAQIAFYEHHKYYNCEKSDYVTHLYLAVMSELSEFVTTSNNTVEGMPHLPFAETIDRRDPEKVCLFKDRLQQLSSEAQEICCLILNSPGDFIDSRPKIARGFVYKKLRQLGWSWPKIWNSFREIKTALNEI